MITQRDFLVWVNCCPFGETIRRVDTFADCLQLGLVEVASNLDDFVTLTTTPSGRVAMPLVLPPTSA